MLEATVHDISWRNLDMIAKMYGFNYFGDECCKYFKHQGVNPFIGKSYEIVMAVWMLAKNHELYRLARGTDFEGKNHWWLVHKSGNKDQLIDAAGYAYLLRDKSSPIYLGPREILDRPLSSPIKRRNAKLYQKNLLNYIVNGNCPKVVIKDGGLIKPFKEES